jgi:hypothetical protein
LTRLGDRAAALAALRQGLETAAATGEHFWDVELHRVTGTVLLAGNELDEGQASFQQAIRVAHAQQAKSLELRAAPASRGCGASRAGGPKPATFSRLSTAGLPRVRHRRSEGSKGAARPVGVNCCVALCE